MKDLSYAFTIFFVTLGPIKVVPPFFLLTHNWDQRTIRVLAFKSTVVATVIVLFVALIVTSMMEKWRVSVEAIAIAGGILLLTVAIKTVTSFSLLDGPVAATGEDRAAAERPSATTARIRWLGKPVLSPIAIPAIIPPIGVVVILFFAGAAIGDNTLKLQLIGVLLAIMVLNFIAMILAGPIMRVVGVPILQVIGWVLTTLQAGLAVEAIIGALRQLHVIP